MWAIAFAALVLIWCGLSQLRLSRPAPALPPPVISIPGCARLTWLGWSALGSGLLVATTAALIHDVAGVPLLWIAP